MIVMIDELTIGERCFRVSAKVEGRQWDGGDHEVGVAGGFEDCECISVDSAEEWNAETEAHAPVTDKATLEILAKGIEEYVTQGDNHILADLSADYDQEEPDHERID